jgi:arylsulfatase A-like enzyme
LQQLGLDSQTLVIWTSDNGAVRWDPPQGSNAPLRGWGYDTSEGAMRMPCIMRWPGHLPAGVTCDELVTTMDMLPTLAALAGTRPPADRCVDGHDCRALLYGEAGARSAYDELGFFYYFIDQLQAVRAGPWKLYLPLEHKRLNLGRKTGPAAAALFDVRHDVGETCEVSAQHPQIVQQLLALAERARQDLGDVDRDAPGQRPAGWVDDPRPQRLATAT